MSGQGCRSGSRFKWAPLNFQRTMNSIFGDFLGTSVNVYLDDIIIASKDVNAHMDTLKAVLQQTSKGGVKAQTHQMWILKASDQVLGACHGRIRHPHIGRQNKSYWWVPSTKVYRQCMVFLGSCRLTQAFHKGLCSTHESPDPTIKERRTISLAPSSTNELWGSKESAYICNGPCLSRFQGPLLALYRHFEQWTRSRSYANW